MSKKILLVALLSAFLLAPVISWAGFGISPGLLNIQNILRGSSFEKTFVISRSDPKEDLLITVEPLGETAEWFQFERGTKFSYPAGEKQFPIKATITVPKGTPNGTYKGKVRFSGGPQKKCEGEECQEGATVGIALGALADITISVTDKEIKGFRVLGAQIERAIEGETLVFILTLENTGNVDIQPDHIIVDIFDKFHRLQLGSFTISRFDGWAKVQNVGRIKATVPYVPEAGNLWAELSIFDHRSQLISKENVPFEVQQGTGQKTGTGLAGGEGTNFWLYLIIGALGGAFLVTIIVLAVLLRYFKRKEKRENKERENLKEGDNPIRTKNKKK